jgi:hypothetical protein
MTSAQRGVRFCGWLLILWLRFLFSAAMAIGLARLGVPAYQDPGWAQWTAWAAPGAKSIGMMIVNLNNGDDEHYYASVDRAIRAASNATEDRGYQKRRRSTVAFSHGRPELSFHPVRPWKATSSTQATPCLIFLSYSPQPVHPVSHPQRSAGSPRVGPVLIY